MTEIYQKYAYEYDELVSHEDYQRNLNSVLNKLFDFNDKKAIEFGTGTGRLTKIYIETIKESICFDSSAHMLEKSKVNLKDYLHKISFQIVDNEKINTLSLKADLVMEGWSFGHTIIDNKNKLKETAGKLIEDCNKLLNPNGKIIIIETFGTNVDIPNAPHDALKEFYDLLEKEFHFKKEIVRTDYNFENALEAKRIMGFFFGEDMKEKIGKQDSSIIKEFTGIWYK